MGSPADTRDIARRMSAGRVCLSRKPLAPARSARSTYSPVSKVVSTRPLPPPGMAAARAVHRDGEQRDQRHARGGHRIDAEQSHDHGEADRPAPAQPHPETTQPTEAEIHGERHRCESCSRLSTRASTVTPMVSRKPGCLPPSHAPCVRAGAPDQVRVADRTGGEQASRFQARRGGHDQRIRSRRGPRHRTKVGPETQTFGPSAPTSDRSGSAGRSGNLFHMTERTALAEGTEVKTSDVRTRLGAAVMGEIPILIVLLTRTMKPPANRLANFVAIR